MSKRKKPIKCQKTGKTKFFNEQAAGKAKMRIWSHDPNANILDLHVYFCDECSGFHVGHRSKYIKYLEKQSAGVTQ